MIRECIRGDNRMCRAFYYQFFPTLMRVCVRYVSNREDAEQLVHDAFLKIFDHLESYKFNGSFEGWIKKITVNLCLDFIRKNQSIHKEIENMTVPTDWQESQIDFQIDEVVTAQFNYSDVLTTLNKLSEKYKLVFNLHVFEGYSFREIAQVLDIKENYAYWLMHQARKELQLIFNSQKK